MGAITRLVARAACDTAVDDRDFLRSYDGPALRIMEVCGTHTSAIFKNGIRSFLSPKIRLISGPGCPVCVTMPAFVDRCIELCLLPGHELLCFGDLFKIPGTKGTLSDAKGAGGRVRMVWSPFDALGLAEQDPQTTYVIAAIGFETTAPAFGLLLNEAEARGIHNIKLLTALKSALAAIDWICEAGEAIDAFLCPGHVSVITGSDAYIPLAKKYEKPFIVAGFEAGRLLTAIRAAVEDAAYGLSGVKNLYPEAVSAKGNVKALGIIARYFDACNAKWRGLGDVEGSGYRLKEAYLAYDAEGLFKPGEDWIASSPSAPRNDEGEIPLCRCGDVVLGRIDPAECPLFKAPCTPLTPIGPCMVSAEGACGIWYRSNNY